MATLYWRKEFVTLHQTDPGYGDGLSGNPDLTIGGFDLGNLNKKYDALSGAGDGTPRVPNPDTDYVEWGVTGATFTLPADEIKTYQREIFGSVGGAPIIAYQTVTYHVWHTATVPDNFQIPNSLKWPPGDTTGPVLTSVSPADNSSAVSVGSDFVLTFSEAVQADIGSFEIYKSDGTRVVNIAMLDTRYVTFSGNTVRINPPEDLALGTDYYVKIDPGVIKDLAGNNFGGITSPTTFNFRTTDPINHAPTAVNDSLAAVPNVAKTINVLANDSDQDGDAISAVVTQGSTAKGSYSLAADGTLTYTPKASFSPLEIGADFQISDSLTYQVRDSKGATASATAKVTIDPIQFEVVYDGTNPLPSPYGPAGTPPAGVDPALDQGDRIFIHIHRGTPGTLFFTAIDPTDPVDPVIRADLNNSHPSLGFQSGGSSVIDFGFGGDHTAAGEVRWLDNNLMPGDYTIELPAGASIQRFVIKDDGAGNDVFWAKSLGNVGQSGAAQTVSATDRLDRVDGADFFKFTLLQPSAVAISLLIDSAGASLTPSLFMEDGASTQPLGMTHYRAASATPYFDPQTTSLNSAPLPAGTYYFSVTGLTGWPNIATVDDNTRNYQVYVSAWTDNAGNDLAHAKDLGILAPGAAPALIDSIEIADPNDYYKFSVASRSTISISQTFNNPNAPVGLQLIRQSPVDSSFTIGGMTTTQIGGTGSTIVLEPGVIYYIRAYSNANYPLWNVDYATAFNYPDGGGSAYTTTLTLNSIPTGSTPILDGDDTANTIIGGDTADVIDAKGGNDIVFGGGGDDTFKANAGNNAYDGGAGSNTISYATAGGAIVFSFPTGTASQNGFGGTDSFSNIQKVVGTAFTDRFVGGANSNVMDGGAGNDTADYSVSDNRVAVNLSTGAAAGGHAQGDTLISIENLIGTGFSGDILTGNGVANVLDGGAGDDVLAGLDGADTLNGNTGTDTADYSASTGRVVVNLATLYAAGGHAQGDLLSSIESLTGTAFDNDILTGNDLDNVLAGGAGADTLDGLGGNDTADYSASDGRVVVNLATLYTAGGDAQGDILVSIENLIGTAFDSDILTGNDVANVFTGGAGADTFVCEGLFGSDRVTDFQDEIDIIQVSGAGAIIDQVDTAAGASYTFANGSTLLLNGISVAQSIDDIVVL